MGAHRNSPFESPKVDIEVRSMGCSQGTAQKSSPKVGREAQEYGSHRNSPKILKVDREDRVPPSKPTFRPLSPPTTSIISVLPDDDDDTPTAAAWPHLHIVYEHSTRLVMDWKGRAQAFLDEGSYSLHKPKGIRRTTGSWLLHLPIVEKEPMLGVVVVRGKAYHMLLLFQLFLLKPFLEVAERALYVWNNERFVKMASQAIHDVFPIIVEGMEKNLKGHWSRSVRQLTENVKEMLEEMEPILYFKCLSQLHHRQSATNEEEMRRRGRWERVEMAAKMNQSIQES
ncbi:Serine/threonine protein phosphatase 2A regulatory subunit B' alpha isoform [Sesamum angolense]|uniref:Serine/threonine protein phosphatase 2A regulatory subunit B' alpha isoform n=1 Tax=Sesamum angolense TaxID=2727404 RepID=A0AAE1WY99_9LAMI|nr:Serine/threonine protein phosphatase 2A regulatory subunit B' alpha isoform [Sesamum angolense]